MKEKIHLTACRFKRTEDSTWENGIAVGKERIEFIVDKDSIPILTNVWNYILDYVKLSVEIEL
jgi:hypothetical protein